jgi:hypothetical protein
MTTRPTRLSGQVLQPPLVATTAASGLSTRFKRATFGFKKKVALTMKDLDLLTSLYVARFIMWRTRRKRH